MKWIKLLFGTLFVFCAACSSSCISARKAKPIDDEIPKCFQKLVDGYQGGLRSLDNSELKTASYMANRGDVNAMNLLAIHYDLVGKEKLANYWGRKVEHMLGPVEEQQWFKDYLAKRSRGES